MTPEIMAKNGTEDSHQKALFCWIALNLVKYPMLKWMHHIKNEERSGNKIAGSIDKAKGVRSGVADNFLPYPAHGKHGLYIEMKIKDGIQSIKQKEFMNDIRKAGYGYCLCYSWQEAVKVLELWIGEK